MLKLETVEPMACTAGSTCEVVRSVMPKVASSVGITW